jgi:hypothetical protein
MSRSTAELATEVVASFVSHNSIPKTEDVWVGALGSAASQKCHDIMVYVFIDE